MSFTCFYVFQISCLKTGEIRKILIMISKCNLKSKFIRLCAIYLISAMCPKSVHIKDKSLNKINMEKQALFPTLEFSRRQLSQLCFVAIGLSSVNSCSLPKLLRLSCSLSFSRHASMSRRFAAENIFIS